MNASQWGSVNCEVPHIDQALNSGLQPGEIGHLYGPAGAGKTTLALQFTVALARRGGSTLYVTTSNDFVKRLPQITGQEFDHIAEQIIVFQPDTFQEQSSIVDRLDVFVTSSVGLIVVDTITAHYRRALETREQNIRCHHELNRQVAILYDIARSFAVPILLTNEVTQHGASDELQPVAKSILAYWSGITLRLLPTIPPIINRRQLQISTVTHQRTLAVEVTNQGLQQLQQ